MTRKKAETERCVIVTTAHRGVFFGALLEQQGREWCRLGGVRNVIYWAGTRGFLGLAAHGPERGSKIGSTAQEVTLYDLTSISDCTPEAVAAFRGWPEP